MRLLVIDRKKENKKEVRKNGSMPVFMDRTGKRMHLHEACF